MRQHLAAAITISALLHLWLAAGLTPTAPLRVPETPPVAALTVKLDLDDAGVESVRGVEPGGSEAQVSTEEALRAADFPGPAGHAPRPNKARSEPNAGNAVKPDRALPPATDPTYYTAHELDAYPRPLEPLGVAYPEGAASEGMAVRVVVQLMIDENGVVRSATIVESVPAGQFDQETLAVLAAARFHPAIKDGRVVRSRIQVRIHQ